MESDSDYESIAVNIEKRFKQYAEKDDLRKFKFYFEKLGFRTDELRNIKMGPHVKSFIDDRRRIENFMTRIMS